MVNAENQEEVVRYDLSEDFSIETALMGMILAEVYRHNQDWKMAAVGNGFKITTLADIAKVYA